jgi:hypothetical protein
MQVIMTRQVDLPVLIKDPKENVVVDIENNHMELTMEDKSIFILPSVETYYSFITEAELCFGDKDIFLDKLFVESKITLVNDEFRPGITIKTVCESSYNDEPIWLLRV